MHTILQSLAKHCRAMPPAAEQSAHAQPRRGVRANLCEGKRAWDERAGGGACGYRRRGGQWTSAAYLRVVGVARTGGTRGGVGGLEGVRDGCWGAWGCSGGVEEGVEREGFWLEARVPAGSKL